MKHMMQIGTSPQFPLHTARACGCGRWRCWTRRDDEVHVKFSYGARPEYYTVDCAAEALRNDSAHCIQWVWLTPPTRRRLAQERRAETALAATLPEVAA